MLQYRVTHFYQACNIRLNEIWPGHGRRRSMQTCSPCQVLKQPWHKHHQEQTICKTLRSACSLQYITNAIWTQCTEKQKVINSTGYDVNDRDPTPMFYYPDLATKCWADILLTQLTLLSPNRNELLKKRHIKRLCPKFSLMLMSNTTNDFDRLHQCLFPSSHAHQSSDFFRFVFTTQWYKKPASSVIQPTTPRQRRLTFTL